MEPGARLDWMRVDFAFWDHPKTLFVGIPAAWLHLRAMAHCGRYLTDGFLSDDALEALPAITIDGKTFDKAELVERLLAKPPGRGEAMWSVAENGYQLHEYTSFQSPRAEVLKRHAALSAAGRKGGQRSVQVRRAEHGTAQPSAAGSEASPEASPEATPEARGQATPEATPQARLRETPEASEADFEYKPPKPPRSLPKHRTEQYSTEQDNTQDVNVELKLDGGLTENPTAYELVFQRWQESTGHQAALFLPRRLRLLRDRRKDGYSFEDLEQAAQGWKFIPHNRGENATKTIYNDFELIFRDGRQVERFRNAFRNRATAPIVPAISGKAAEGANLGDFYRRRASELREQRRAS